MVLTKNIFNPSDYAGSSVGQTIVAVPAGLSALEWSDKIDELRVSVEKEMRLRDEAVWVNNDSVVESQPVKQAVAPSSPRSDKVLVAKSFVRDAVKHHSETTDYHGKAQIASCFARACLAAGVDVPSNIRSVDALSQFDVAMVNRLSQLYKFKVVFTVYGQDDPRNHIDLVDSTTANCKVHVRPLNDTSANSRTVVCTTMQQFFNLSNGWQHHVFYADDGTQPEIAGDSFGGARDRRSEFDQTRSRRDNVPAPQSVVAESVHGGSSNVSGGVRRSKKRVLASKSTALGGPIVKNYRTSNAVMFNNVEELFQDKISREYAQEIIEELFEIWGVPLEQPEAVKYAEDLLFTFLIGTTASNKADYNRAFDVPVKPLDRNGETVSSIEADFSLFSKLLESKFGVTRRQFARGVADDLRAFLRLEENQQLLPPLATRIGCEPLLAYLAFDGSTHCSNMTTREITFTKTLESRNLFERDDVIAQGASDRLMQGMSGGTRSIVAR